MILIGLMLAAWIALFIVGLILGLVIFVPVLALLTADLTVVAVVVGVVGALILLVPFVVITGAIGAFGSSYLDARLSSTHHSGRRSPLATRPRRATSSVKPGFVVREDPSAVRRRVKTSTSDRKDVCHDETQR